MTVIETFIRSLPEAVCQIIHQTRGRCSACASAAAPGEEAPDEEHREQAADEGDHPLGHGRPGGGEQVDRLGVGLVDAPDGAARRAVAGGRRGRLGGDRGRDGRLRGARVADGAAAAGDAAPVGPASTSRSRLSTNWPSSLLDTSARTPRPNWATLPVMVRSVTTVTRVPSPSGTSVAVTSRVGVALAPGVAALGLEHDPVGRDVMLLEAGGALVLRGDRADLDLDDPAVVVALDLLQLGTRHAGRDPLDVGQDGPGVIDGHADPELVAQLHVASLLLPIPAGAVVRLLVVEDRLRRDRPPDAEAARRGQGLGAEVAGWGERMLGLGAGVLVEGREPEPGRRGHQREPELHRAGADRPRPAGPRPARPGPR